MTTQPDPVADAAGRPGFTRFIRQEGDYEGAAGFGFAFGAGEKYERYAMLYHEGMSPLAFAAALEKITAQMREQTGANGQEQLAGNEVNASDFTRLPSPASEQWEEVERP